jgi:hypothetical protein
MREGLDAATFELPPENIEEIRSFLDGQSRIELAVWVRHEQAGAGGPLYDHHLVLGVDDEDWAAGDMRALEQGLELPRLDTSEPTWIDIFPVSEVAALRSFATVLWEQTSAGADPLDYRLTYAPFAPEPTAAERFAALLAEKPEIRSVAATVEQLWKGDRALGDTVLLFVEACIRADALMVARDAARTTVLEGVSSYGVSLGPATVDRTATLYDGGG